MPANVEIKARARNVPDLLTRVRAAAGEPVWECLQEDVFFNTDRGRLKLRTAANGSSELISYYRADSAGPKRSSYSLCPVADPRSLRIVLGAALGVRGVVRKQRRLYLCGRTRIHIDEVDGLGAFMELEVMLEPGEDETSGQEEAIRLMKRLGIDEEDLIDRAYIDLLEEKTDSPVGGLRRPENR